MPDNAPDVRLQVTAEEQGVASAISSLSAQLKELAGQEKATEESSLNLSEALEGILEVLAVEKIIEFGKEVFDSATAISLLSDKTGISSETLSVYQSAVTKAGGSSEDFSAGIGQLAKQLTLAEQGSARAAKAVELTGVKLSSLSGLSADEKLKAITNALAAMPPGFAKTTAEEKLLGDSTGRLTQALQSLSGDGFEKVYEEALKSGNILTGQTKAEFDALRQTVNELKEQAEGLTLQFESGLAPALVAIGNAISSSLGGEGVSGFKTLGEEAGAVLKGITFGISSIGISAGVTAAELVEIFDLAWNHTASAAKLAFATIGGYIEGGVGGAAAKGATLLATTQDKALAEFADRIKAIEASAEKSQNDLYEKLFNPPAITPKAPPKPGGDSNVVNETAAKNAIKAEEQADTLFAQQLAFQVRQIQQEVDLQRAKGVQIAGIDEAQFDEGIISLTTYYDKRRSLIVDENNREIAAIRQQIALETDARDRAAKEQAANSAKASKAGGQGTPLGAAFSAQATKDAEAVGKANQSIADLNSKLAISQVNAATKVNAEDLAAFKAKQEQATKLAAFDKQILDIQGKTTEAAQAETDAKVQEYRTLLTSKLGAGNPEIDAQVKKFQDLTTAQAAFNEARTAGDTATKTLQDQIAAIQDQVNQGKIFQIEADKQIRDAEAGQIPLLQSIADKQKAAALATGNQANVAKANDFQRSVTGFKTASDQAQDQAKQLREGVQNTLTGSFDQFLTQGIFAATSVGGAFLGLADSVVSSLQKIVTQMLVNIAIQKLLSGFGGGFAAGGAVSGSAPVAAATGGYISGPGGPTSDSIPAALSDGEYVLKARAVSAIGVPLLDLMNNATRSAVSFGRSSMHGYAEGGLVGGSKGSSNRSAVHLAVSLEKGIILQHMASKEGAKVTISHIASNPKKANAAIGRSK